MKKSSSKAKSAAVEFINVHDGQYVEHYDEERIAHLRADLRKQVQNVDDLLTLGSRLSNCCWNAGQAGGFKDVASGMMAEEVAELLINMAKKWDHLEEKVRGLSPRPVKDITEKR